MNKFVFALILAPTPSETRTWTLGCEASPLIGAFPQKLVHLSTRKAYLYSFLGMGMLCFRFPREHLRPIHAACTAEVTASVQKSPDSTVLELLPRRPNQEAQDKTQGPLQRLPLLRVPASPPARRSSAAVAIKHTHIVAQRKFYSLGSVAGASAQSEPAGVLAPAGPRAQS
jgi:hypothetical protein